MRELITTIPTLTYFSHLSRKNSVQRCCSSCDSAARNGTTLITFSLKQQAIAASHTYPDQRHKEITLAISRSMGLA